MLTRPFTRLVVAFGQRKVTQRRFVEEIVLGIWILIPFGFLMGLLTSRICSKIQVKYIRSDIWTTIVVFLVGDMLMEWLLPSLSCLPAYELGEDSEGYNYNFSWLLQSYGLYCPPDFSSSSTLLSPDATAILFSLRLVFLCVGVHIGESLCFVALTGGIATGKSTVSQLLEEYKDSSTNTTTSNSKKKGKKNSTSDSSAKESSDEYKEGTVQLICADSIAHEILLPPSVLEQKGEDKGDGQIKPYLVHPNDSVYPTILSVFDGEEILTPEGTIDRLKLGAIVFKNPAQRRKLNKITHPKIMMVLVQQLLRGVFFGNCDITVADIPLLFESGKLSWLFAITICVTVLDPSVQLARLRERNPELSAEECQARIDSQIPLEKKQKLADIVLDNSGSLEDLKEQVEQVRRDLMGRLYGIGMSLLQMLLLIGGSTSIAVSSKFYTSWQQ